MNATLEFYFNKYDVNIKIPTKETKWKIVFTYLNVDFTLHGDFLQLHQKSYINVHLFFIAF